MLELNFTVKAPDGGVRQGVPARTGIWTSDGQGSMSMQGKIPENEYFRRLCVTECRWHSFVSDRSVDLKCGAAGFHDW